jgi:hypothetical protein
MKHHHVFSLGAALALSSLAAVLPALAAPTYEDVAARFNTTTCALPCTAPQSGDWYLWRGENRVEVRAGSGEVGEIWRRDGKGRVDFVYVEPAHKRGIEYNASDLRIIGHTRSWDRLASLIPPAELEKLSPAGETEVLGHKAQRYSGKLGQRTLEVVWLPDLQIAARVSVTYPDRQVTTELKGFLGKDDIAATSDDALAAYQLVDFSDLGDMETKPSMAWVKEAVAAPGHEGHTH